MKLTADVPTMKAKSKRPKIHTKAIVIDAQQAFIGSANLTGAGLGAKWANKRNFESGFFTQDSGHLRELME